MPTINVPWTDSWPTGWGRTLTLDGLFYSAGSVTYRGAMGLYVSAPAHNDLFGVPVADQGWERGLLATSVTVIFSRGGSVGSAIELFAYDTNGTQVGHIASTVYPGGRTSVVIPVFLVGADLAAFQLTNNNWPTAIDVKVEDLFASIGVVTRQWTNYLGCGET